MRVATNLVTTRQVVINGVFVSGMTETAPTPSITPLTAGTAPISSLTPLTTASLFSDDDDDDDLFAALRHTKDTLRSTHRPTDSTVRGVVMGSVGCHDEVRLFRVVFGLAFLKADHVVGCRVLCVYSVLVGDAGLR